MTVTKLKVLREVGFSMILSKNVYLTFKLLECLKGLTHQFPQNILPFKIISFWLVSYLMRSNDSLLINYRFRWELLTYILHGVIWIIVFKLLFTHIWYSVIFNNLKYKINQQRNQISTTDTLITIPLFFLICQIVI